MYVICKVQAVRSIKIDSWLERPALLFSLKAFQLSYAAVNGDKPTVFLIARWAGINPSRPAALFP